MAGTERSRWKKLSDNLLPHADYLMLHDHVQHELLVITEDPVF